MDGLREDEFALLDYLDDNTHELYDDAIFEIQRGGTGSTVAAEVIVELITKLARAVSPLPGCGHPRGCIVACADDDGSDYCGWCASRNVLIKLNADCDDLREKLASIRHIVVTGHRVSLVDLSE